MKTIVALMNKLRYYNGPWVPLLGITISAAISAAALYALKWSMEAITEAGRSRRPPPTLPAPPVFTKPAPPPPLASAIAQCFPVLTEDAHLLAIDRCDRQGGFASSGRVFVDCWQGQPYEDGSHLIWHYGVEQATVDDAHAMLREAP